MEYLIACDLEGIHGVVGEENKGLLRDLPDYTVAIRNAEKEINAAARALFDAGASKVCLWDNHGGGNNIDESKIDKRVTFVYHERGKCRFDLVRKHNFSGIVYLGYHAREGTRGAVLAHTYSSVSIQYIKIDGAPVGELDIDTYICAMHGISPLFSASDDICTEQFHSLAPSSVAVITKYAKGRNAAEFIDESTVLENIYKGVFEAAKRKIAPIPYKTPASVEIRYTRMEMAEVMYKRALDMNIPVKFGEDAHILHFTIERMNELPFFA